MAAPAYATDLANIIEDMASSTGWTLISSGGGGANSFTVPETDDYIQGNNCISRNPWSSSIRGMLFNAATTIATDDAVYIWWKADVAQALATEASGGVQILIGSKKKELGLLPEEVEAEVDQDRIEDDGSAGALTDGEKARVMLDLRPE